MAQAEKIKVLEEEVQRLREAVERLQSQLQNQAAEINRLNLELEGSSFTLLHITFRFHLYIFLLLLVEREEKALIESIKNSHEATITNLMATTAGLMATATNLQKYIDFLNRRN